MMTKGVLTRLWTQVPKQLRGTTLIAFPAACLALTLGAWIWTRVTEKGVAEQANRTEEIITKSNEVLIGLINAETAVRGYWIVRDPVFLEPYQLAITQVPNTLTRLDQTAQDDLDRTEKIQRLRAQVQERMDSLKLGIQLSKTLPSNYQFKRSSLIYTNKARMDKVRATIDELQAEERLRLDSYKQQLIVVQDRASVIITIMALLSFIGSAGAIYIFRSVDQDLLEQESLVHQGKFLLKTITSNVVDSVIALDDQGKIENFNPAAVQLFGYQQDEIIGQDLSYLLVDPIPYEKPDPQGAPHSTHKLTGIRKDKTQVPIELSMSEVQLNSRRIVIIRDISTYLQIEASLKTRADQLTLLSTQLATANETLQVRNNELDQFAYVASHDLKAPLRAIANLSQWIEEDLEEKLSPDNQHQMQLLRGRVNRMEVLINGLLDYSRAGRIQLPTETVAVKDLLAEVLDSLDPPDLFTIIISPEMPVLKTKKLLLNQVFTNLIGNAIRHHPNDHGTIQISVEDRQDQVEFSIKDDGSGIDPLYHEKIFAIFQTLEARDVKEGAGIGLSIVKRIVETQGGRIRLESELGKGSVFYFTWPKSVRYSDLG